MREHPVTRSVLQAFGARVALSCDAPDLLSVIRSAFPSADGGSFLEPAGNLDPDVSYFLEAVPGGRELRFAREGSELARGAPDLVVRSLIDTLHFDVALHARQASFLHASVVRWRHRLLVFPGRSRAGKSSIAASLCARGAIYYSDEFAPIDDLGRVMPYPKSISLREGLRPSGPSTVVHPAGDGVAPADAVIFTSYQPNAHFQPLEIGFEAAALALIDNAVVAMPKPHQAAAAVARMLAHRPRLAQSARGEVEEFVEALDDWLACPPL